MTAERQILDAMTRTMACRGVPYPATQDPTYDVALREGLAKLLTEDGPALPLIDRARAEAAAAGTPDDDLHRTDIEFVLQLDTWLRDYQVRLDLAG